MNEVCNITCMKHTVINYHENKLLKHTICDIVYIAPYISNNMYIAPSMSNNKLHNNMKVAPNMSKYVHSA